VVTDLGHHQPGGALRNYLSRRAHTAPQGGGVSLKARDGSADCGIMRSLYLFPQILIGDRPQKAYGLMGRIGEGHERHMGTRGSAMDSGLTVQSAPVAEFLKTRASEFVLRTDTEGRHTCPHQTNYGPLSVAGSPDIVITNVFRDTLEFML
jgi:hypothetical protein